MINNQLEIWEDNSNKLLKLINKMIYLSDMHKELFIKNNIEFMNTKFNEQIYLDELIKIFELK